MVFRSLESLPLVHYKKPPGEGEKGRLTPQKKKKLRTWLERRAREIVFRGAKGEVDPDDARATLEIIEAAEDTLDEDSK